MIHRVNFGQFKLSTDVEKNPGPSVYVDATKTIHAPYCQGNVVSIWEKCALIYSKIRRITSVDDMIQIMTARNQRYSSLSFLVRQSMLMLTELPEMRTVFEQFSSLNTVKVIFVTCMVMPELRGITTVCQLKHSWL